MSADVSVFISLMYSLSSRVILHDCNHDYSADVEQVV